MPLQNPRAFFGIHSVTPYRREDRTPYGILRVLGDSSLSLSGELIPLNGGSNLYPWKVENGLNTVEISLTFREYPDFVFEIFLGKAPTANSAESAGNVSALENAKGTSVLDATTGIASVGLLAADEADLKFSRYVVKAVSATTVDVYASSNIDFATGTDVEYVDDTLKINASPITIPDSSGTVSLADYGLEFTGGSGSVAMTVDDTAIYEVRPVNTASSIVSIGSNKDVVPEVGMYIYAKKSGDKQMAEFDCYRVKAVGLPIGLTENAFSEASVTAQAFYDSALDGVFEMRFVEASV